MNRHFPYTTSEFEVQSDLYQGLLNEGFIVRGEVTMKIEKTTLMPDIVVYDYTRDILCIVEVKNEDVKDFAEMTSKSSEFYNTNQYYKYTLASVPVYICLGKDWIEYTIDLVRKLLQSKYSRPTNYSVE